MVQEAEELGTTWWTEIRARSEFAFRCSAFGHKERMASIRAARAAGSEDSEESSEQETSLSQVLHAALHCTA